MLLLDEPCEGLAPVIVEELGAVIEGLKTDMPILLAEQNARFALSISDRGYVIDKGVIRYEGTRKTSSAIPRSRPATSPSREPTWPSGLAPPATPPRGPGGFPRGKARNRTPIPFAMSVRWSG